MAQALLRPSPGWQPGVGAPDLRLAWHGFRIDASDVERLLGLAHGRSPDMAGRLSVLMPHVTGFRLLMALLTQPAWPLPIWNALQVRNRLIQHRRFVPGNRHELASVAGGWRVLDKGLEIDIHTRMTEGACLVWESIVTFYYRGRFGARAQHGEQPGAPANAPVPTSDWLTTWQGRCDGTGRWGFARMTGDYNGVHQWNRYARHFGFPAAFAHSQRLAAQCIAHLPPLTSQAQRLDLWIKGPVGYGNPVLQRQCAARDGDEVSWGLWNAKDSRPALLGRWTALRQA